MSTFAATTVTFPTSANVPIALGFVGLGVGFLIYGAQELFALSERDRSVDLTTGIWGIWMPGFPTSASSSPAVHAHDPGDPHEEPRALNKVGARELGFFRLATGAWLMHLTFAVTLNTTSGTSLPV